MRTACSARERQVATARLAEDPRAQIEREVLACGSASSLLRLVARSQARIIVTGCLPAVWERASELTGLLARCGSDQHAQLLPLLLDLTEAYLPKADLQGLISLAASAGLCESESASVQSLLSARLSQLLADLPSLRRPEALELLCLLPERSSAHRRLLSGCQPLLGDPRVVAALSTPCLLRLLTLALGPVDERAAGLPRRLADSMLAALAARAPGLPPAVALRALRALARVGARLGSAGGLESLAGCLAERAVPLLPALGPAQLCAFAGDVRALCGCQIGTGGVLEHLCVDAKRSFHCLCQSLTLCPADRYRQMPGS